MHLKLDIEGAIDDGDVARDLGQAPADIVILSAADSDLASFAAALGILPDGFPSVRLTNLLALGHPASVDAYVARTLKRAKIVILRMLGGEGYWPYGVESLRSEALRRGSLFACLPGELTWNVPLAARGTLNLEHTETLWRYCVEGGIDNSASALQFAAHLIGQSSIMPPPPRPMPAAGFWTEPDQSGRANVAVIFYRAIAMSGDTAPIEAICEALRARGLNPVPIYVTSLKDERSIAFLDTALAAFPPAAVINATAFATGTAGDERAVLGRYDCPVLQIALAGSSRSAWESSSRGLSPRDLAMHVVLPEVDGRIFAHAVAFKEKGTEDVPRFAPTVLRPVPDRVEASADLAAAWIRLRTTPPQRRKVALVLANYPNRDGRLANGVGLDTPQSVVDTLKTMREAGYDIGDTPRDDAGLMRLLQRGPTNALVNRATRTGGIAWPIPEYQAVLDRLPTGVRTGVAARWGEAHEDPYVTDGCFRLALHRFGNLLVGIQPSRGYNIDPKSTYHDPDLVPPHHYVAFYLWLRQIFGAHAVIHFGKHGNLEWLPGKSTGLSRTCYPDAILGPIPHLYPFIVNDPGEGIQAKRRSAAAIVDHLTPPLSRAELHDELAHLESMVDEYALAADLDPKRAAAIADEILSMARAKQLDADLALTREASVGETLRALDAHLCDLKEMQIRDGLHVFGTSPQATQRIDLLVSIARMPRSDLRAEDASLHRAIALDLGLADFDPLTRDLGAAYGGPKPVVLRQLLDRAWRTNGDAVERIELLAAALVSGGRACDPAWTRTAAVLRWIDNVLAPAIDDCGRHETSALMRGLDGRFIKPGPAGAPTRGRPDVLPTGRNFFAVDVRAVPTPSAWRIGRLAAERLVENHWREQGEWPRSIALSAWGTANMRTGGDDVAQALALIGAQPVWEAGTGRVTGFSISPLSDLGRPRIDVTFRVSGLFRDAFPLQMDLIDSAVRAVAALDEPADANPLAAAVRSTAARLQESGVREDEALRRATYRVFGSKPGAYGAGLQALIDERQWEHRSEIADVYLAFGGYAYGAGSEGVAEAATFSDRLATVDLVAQAQDNREHDILDADDYYQFMGGLAATVEHLRRRAPRVAHVDTSRPEAPVARNLAHEISRVVRGRAANPKWIAGVMRHGYKGAFEIAATVDYLFGFAASTRTVSDHHFDQLFSAYLENDRVRGFMAEANPAALRETVARFQEAIRRGFWRPRSNSAADILAALAIDNVNPKEAAT
ncbi:cobaltochelatase subunit CobN [Bradyrhizobium sp. LHD-71]|uniref:cobaltochelatase subunit CobN n=1 Tax=Bradyrhizobium sp. LHD-71 TaxID=3072141 RepID=UPI00280D2B92|nr:cobaltochelatase subunit CobN [Bradyrhizobium sp. LHD-71]MDQ8729719.1 cobaltochelatase subunit CobN [Bradyrhizobium sp. LHD-71]